MKKHETVQKILKKKQTPRTEVKDTGDAPPNDFLDNLVARQGQQPPKKATTQHRVFRPDYMKRPAARSDRGNGAERSGSRTPPRY